MTELFRIPRYLDSPAQLLWWEIDEVAVVVLMISLGIAFEYFFVCATIGLVAAKAMRRVKEGKQDNYLLHWLFWHGVPGARLKTGPPGAWRIFVE